VHQFFPAINLPLSGQDYTSITTCFTGAGIVPLDLIRSLAHTAATAFGSRVGHTYAQRREKTLFLSLSEKQEKQSNPCRLVRLQDVLVLYGLQLLAEQFRMHRLSAKKEGLNAYYTLKYCTQRVVRTRTPRGTQAQTSFTTRAVNAQTASCARTHRVLRMRKHSGAKVHTAHADANSHLRPNL
jgi:hypothetical protein